MMALEVVITDVVLGGKTRYACCGYIWTVVRKNAVMVISWWPRAFISLDFKSKMSLTPARAAEKENPAAPFSELCMPHRFGPRLLTSFCPVELLTFWCHFF